MKSLLLILIIACGIFGRRHRAQAPQRPAPQPAASRGDGHWVWEGGVDGKWKWEQTTYKWVETPHFHDGYWTKTDFSGFVDYLWKNQRHTPNDEEYWKAIYRKRIEQYPFQPWVWDWPGRKDSDITWHVEMLKSSDKPPEKPKRWIKQESYNSFWPGQRDNL